MKIKGRKESSNIEDLRNYFGSDAYDPDYPNEDRMQDFANQTLLSPYVDKGDQPMQQRPKKRKVTAITIRGVPPG